MTESFATVDNSDGQITDQITVPNHKSFDQNIWICPSLVDDLKSSVSGTKYLNNKCET